MATIYTLTKKGKVVKDKVGESVSDVWSRINGEYEPNFVYNNSVNRDYVFLTDSKGKSFIFNKRYLWKITE